MSGNESSDARFDVLVIGAGPGGMAAATRAALKGLKVGLVNGKRLWGYGIHGAYKSKGMYELAKDHLVAKKSGRGYRPSTEQIDFSQVQAQLQQGSAELEALYEAQIASLAITEIRGMGEFSDSHTVRVAGSTYRADNFVLATGTTPRWVPSIFQDGNLIMSSDEIVSLDRLPESLLILGAGVVGCEFASIFSSFGSRITLLDAYPVILSHEDDDLIEFLTENFESRGIRLLQSARVVHMEASGGRVMTRLVDGAELDSEMALVSIGRAPCTAALKLDRAGVTTDAQGYISINEFCQTNREHIYAVGDVGLRHSELDMALVHVAEAEGHQAIHHILSGETPIPMDHIPFIIFTIPLIAGAGENEKMARKRHGDVRVARLKNVHSHRAHAMRSFGGFVKLIVGPEGDDRLLGVRACGPQADTLIGEVSLCIANGLPYTHLMDAVHAHPSLSESLHNAARILAGLYPTHD